MSFRLLPNAVTLNSVIAPKAPTLRYFTKVCASFGRITKKWLKIHRYFWQQKCSPTNIVFTALHVMQTRYSDENSVRPSVCHTRVL